MDVCPGVIWLVLASSRTLDNTINVAEVLEVATVLEVAEVIVGRGELGSREGKKILEA